jgi:hypothetical protein
MLPMIYVYNKKFFKCIGIQDIRDNLKKKFNSENFRKTCTSITVQIIYEALFKFNLQKCQRKYSATQSTHTNYMVSTDHSLL